MKKLLIIVSIFIATSAIAEAKSTYVRGYTRKDGTYVHSYTRGGSSNSVTTFPYAPSNTTVTPYTNPLVVTPSSIPAQNQPLQTKTNINWYPADFANTSIPCGDAFIAKDKVCHFNTLKAKTNDFNNCTEAWGNGVKDIPTNSPAYSKKLDRDGDGIACEVSDMYVGNTWMYGKEINYDSVDSDVDYCRTLKDIPKTSAIYREIDDRDKDGISCESNGDDKPLQ